MKRAWYQITNHTVGAPAEVMLYGEIGGGWASDGVEARSFVEEFNAIPPTSPITLRIHSPGGSVFDGLAIYNTIAARRSQVTAVVDGMALSAASFIAMAAGKVVMPKTSRMMIHDAQGVVVGDSADMREMSDLLARESDAIAQIYATKTRRTPTEMRGLMRETTWMDGEEAVAGGFADEVTSAASIENSFNLSVFRRVPAEFSRATNTTSNMTPTPVPSAVSPAPVAAAATLVPVPPIPAPTTQPSNLAVADDLKALREDLARERAARLGRDLSILAQAHDIDETDWLPRVLADESVLVTLAKLPRKIPTGADPIAFGRVTNMGNPFLEAYAKMEPGAVRNAYRIENHDELIKQRKAADPRNANTIAAALTTDYLADGIINVAASRMAPLSLFNTDFSQDGYKPRATVQIRHGTVTSTAQTDPTNFETGDSTITNIPVPMHQISKSFQVTNDELNRGTRLAHLAGLNAVTFANAISDVWTSLLDGAGTDFGPGLVVGLPASWNVPGTVLPPILDAAKNYVEQNLIVDGSYIAHLMPVNTYGFMRTPGNGFKDAYGFNVITPQNRWTSALANTVGLVCSRNALAIIAGMPLDLPPGEMISQQVVTLKDINLSVQLNTWFSRAGRVQWSSYDCMFGAAVGDNKVGKILISA